MIQFLVEESVRALTDFVQNPKTQSQNQKKLKTNKLTKSEVGLVAFKTKTAMFAIMVLWKIVKVFVMRENAEKNSKQYLDSKLYNIIFLNKCQKLATICFEPTVKTNTQKNR